MTKLLSIIIKSAGILLIMTVLGQIPVKGRSLENRYHHFVNSPGFQDAYWNLVRPVTWSWDKSQELVREFREKRAANAR
jgi:hypothetical protein